MKKLISFLLGLALVFYTSPSQAASTGQNDILVILVNFQDTEGLSSYQGPVTRDNTRAIVFEGDNSVAQFYYETSYGQIDLGGDIFPSTEYESDYYQLNINHTCNLSAISTAAMQALDAEEGENVNFLEYEHLIVVIPDGDCLRGLGYVGKINFVTPDGNHSMTIGFVEDNTMFSPYGIAHELGHGFGVYHAGLYNCGEYPYNNTGCTTAVSSDLFSIMGLAVSRPGQFTAPHKDMAGFFDAQHKLIEVSPDNINNSGIYGLTAYESMNPGNKAIKVWRSNGLYWYLEFRQPLGFDARVSGGDIEYDRVIIHSNDLSSKDPNSILVDAGKGDKAWASAGIKADTHEPHTNTTGFYDPVDGTKIEVVSIAIDGNDPNNSTAEIKITFANQDETPDEPEEIVEEPVDNNFQFPLIPINEVPDLPEEPVENIDNNLPQVSVSVVDLELTNRLKGRILLQVESLGEAWYVKPDDGKRIYMKDGDAAYGLMRDFGLGITNADLAKIPIGFEDRFECLDSDGDGLCDKLEDGLGTDKYKKDSDSDGYEDGEEVKNNYDPAGPGALNYDISLANRLKGKILLQVESHGEAWYINPVDGNRYYMPDGPSAYQIMRFLSLGISNSDLSKIAE